MSSTQRSESANHMLKRFVPRNCSMNMFVQQFNKLLFDRNMEEDRAEHETKIFNNVRQRAWPIEEHAMTFYTAAVYELFRKEIDKSTHYHAVEVIKDREYNVLHVKPRKKYPWYGDAFKVVVNGEGESYHCECGLYQHFGVLCSHVLRVLVQQGIPEIPKAHIMKRWTHEARDILPKELRAYQKDNLSLDSMTFRFKFLYVNAIGVVDAGNEDRNTFNIVAQGLKKIQKKIDEYRKAKQLGNRIQASNIQRFDKGHYTTDSDAAIDSASDIENTRANTFGAAGSSAGMSDSELLAIKAPSFKRSTGRPRCVRFKGPLDAIRRRERRKRQQPPVENEPLKKNKTRCGACHVIGHSSKHCKNKYVDLNTEIPDY
ncbi:hypothetical protein ACP70R_025187 [Stipagrostis hirtigluma subsp. patula]